MCRAHSLPLALLLLLMLLVVVNARRTPAGRSALSADVELLPEQGRKPGTVSYVGYQVLRVQVADNTTAELLKNFENVPGVQFWSETALAGPVDVLVSPEAGPQLTKQLTRAGVTYTVNIDNVQASIERENPVSADPRLQSRQNLQRGHPLTWRAYHRLAAHHQFIDFITRRTRGPCQAISIGTSTEGRDLKGVRCGCGQREIWIDGGIHAREWISPAVVSFLISEFSQRRRNADILRRFTLYIIPVLNPDGYEFSHTDDRLWRKTRSKNRDSSCIGVDANRNFDVSWGESGTSQDPCSVTYGGPHPFSEPETRAVRDFVLEHKDNLEMFITLHSYSELLFVPYAFTVRKPDDYAEVRRVAQRGVDALRATSGRSFVIPTTTEFNKLSGVSDDWAKKAAGVKYTYTFELRDKGQHGFMLPAEQIEPSGREIAAAVKAMIRALPAGPHPRGVGPARSYGSGISARRCRFGFARPKDAGRRRY